MALSGFAFQWISHSCKKTGQGNHLEVQRRAFSFFVQSSRSLGCLLFWDTVTPVICVFSVVYGLEIGIVLTAANF